MKEREKKPNKHLPKKKMMMAIANTHTIPVLQSK